MATQFEIDCALMAGASYASTRSDINKFPIPAGWEVVPNSHFKDASEQMGSESFSNN